MKIRTIFFAVFSLLSLAVEAQVNTNVVDEVVWVVGDKAILKSDVENARIDAVQLRQQLDGDPYCVIPEQLAVQKLFVHQAEVDSIEVADADVYRLVDMDLNSAIADYGSREKLEAYAGRSMNEIREAWFKNYRDRQIVSQVQQSLIQDLKVTPSQVRRFFKDMPEDSVPFIPTKVECQIITREPRIPQSEIDRVKNELRDYTERVNRGDASFATLAMMYSEDTGSKMNGGELGLSGRGAFVPEFANVAFNLTSKNAISKIVETEYGYHIIQLIEKVGDQVNCRHILRKPQVSSDSLAVCLTELDSIVAEINADKYTFDECVKYVSYDKDTRSNYGLMVNKRSMQNPTGDGSSRLEMQQLPAAVAAAVAGLEVGQISKPFIMENRQGKSVAAVVKLKNRINGHRATMEEDYQVLQNMVLEKLSEEKIDNWIREKQKTTYVRINEGWQNCEFKYPGWVKE